MNEIDVFIEIPYHSNVKYEIDDNNHLRVDRVLSTSMVYPGNYGYIPDTLAGDGDPLDAIIINHTPFVPGCFVKCRVIGILNTMDENGMDEKVICVPIDKIEKKFSKYQDITDVSESKLNMIKHFFENYKSLEFGKYVKVTGFGNKEQAWSVIYESYNRKKIETD